ncbi:MAG: phosphatidylglycerophosphatase A [Candidatus Marinimicrobia bacterium]|nr:phosphatidylglycerophosphatase A [Candidatus Neomarinimicrobiota bacterium]
MGKLPYAPGTWGSLGAILIWWYIPHDLIIQSIFILLSIIIGTWSSQIYANHLNLKDPSEIVIDEVSGMWITLFFVPHQLSLFIIGFVLFRFFDIKKPWLIDKVQYYSGGIGIMADDILAGIFSRIIIYIGVILFL